MAAPSEIHMWSPGTQIFNNNPPNHDGFLKPMTLLKILEAICSIVSFNVAQPINGNMNSDMKCSVLFLYPTTACPF